MFEYPFSPDFENKKSSKLTLGYNFNFSKGSEEFLFPDIISKNTAYHHCEKKSKWNNLIYNLMIYCKEVKIKTLIIIFDNDNFKDFNVDLYEKIDPPLDWNPVEKYEIGTHICINKNIQNTLQNLPPKIPFQIFIGNPKSYEPSITPSCLNLINEKELSIYVHAPYIFNLARPNKSSNMKKFLIEATKHGMKGVVFHVGKSVNMNIEEAYKNMENNILDSIDDKLCPLLLETPAGQGTEMLTNYEDFLNFSIKIKNKKKGNFGICLDSCHINSTGYCPYQYLKYFIKKKEKIDLIHYNDSQTNLRSKVDRHAEIGMGKINWKSLENFAKLANKHKIDMVTEF